MGAVSLKNRIVVIAFPWKSPAPYKFLEDLLKILSPLSKKIILITGNTELINNYYNNVDILDINIKMHRLSDYDLKIYSAILWVLKCILSQIKMSFHLIKNRHKYEIVLFYMAYPYFLLPLVTARIMHKKTIEIVTRSQTNGLFPKILGIQDKVFYNLLDGISPESNYLINELNLDKYTYKLLPEGARFIDTEKFRISKSMEKRKNIIGFIGRLNYEKGILKFLNSIKLLNKYSKNYDFLIIGEGPLKKNIIEKISEYEMKNVKFLDWLPNDELPNHLNSLKLLVLPSNHGEGVPTIILEAMACGTPVLSTKLSGIHDLVIDSKTGFLMSNNNPKCITKNIIRAINNENFNEISINAQRIVSKRYNYKSAIIRYDKILGN